MSRVIVRVQMPNGNVLEGRHTGGADDLGHLLASCPVCRTAYCPTCTGLLCAECLAYPDAAGRPAAELIRPLPLEEPSDAA